jgi:uncharacterized HAD superfamily protein
MRIGLDIDDVICNFYYPYLERFGNPTTDGEITRNVTRILVNDKDFWLNLPIKHRPNFTPSLYCTKRYHPKQWSKKFLEINNLPVAPIYQVYCQISSKAPRIKGRVDVFVDDSISNFIDCNLRGVPCLLMDSEYNQQWGPIGRVYDLEEEHILEAYELFRSTVFNDFRDLVDGY